MSKLAIFLGILLMIGAFVVLFALVIPMEELATNPTIAAAKNSLFCQPGERYVQEFGEMVSGPGSRALGRELTIYCENNEGQQREITSQAVMTMIAAFAAPFVIGLLLLLGGIFAAFAGWMRRLARVTTSDVPVSVYSSKPGQTVQYTTTSTNLSNLDLPPEAAEVIKQVMGSFQGSAQSFQAGGSDDNLVTKLRQLDEARDTGLISSTEYDRMRQQILDNMKE